MAVDAVMIVMTTVFYHQMMAATFYDQDNLIADHNLLQKRLEHSISHHILNTLREKRQSDIYRWIFCCFSCVWSIFLFCL